jgi:1-pyrroline-5-carboxylate dehydrogenase
VRFHFSCSEGMAGDCTGERGDLFKCWPFGPVLIIAPFNFPLEIPALQLIGALAVGNKPLLKTSSRQQFPNTHNTLTYPHLYI